LKRLHISFPSGELSLEGVWHLPDSNGPLPAVIVCHPHSLYGGNMSANVVFYTCQALAGAGIAALRFNFRGVGKSEGHFGGGIGEQEDVRAALEFALATDNIDKDRIGLAGYSFGGGVAAAVAVGEERIKMLALVSPALEFGAGGEKLKDYPKPKFIIIGENDDVIPQGELRELFEAMPEPKRYEAIPGADHFWEGFVDEVADKVTGFFKEGLTGRVDI
jgi:alpha/beta superfamily hydrolase